MDSFDCTNIQTPENLWAGVDPNLVPKEDNQHDSAQMTAEWNATVLLSLLQSMLQYMTQVV